MDKEKEALKAEMRKKIDEGLDEIMAHSFGDLEQMEEAVGKLKAKLGQETLERLIELKKNSK